MRRHKFGFAAAAAVIVALTVGVAVSTWQAVRARTAQAAANAAEKQAKENTRLADQERARAQASDIAAREELENTRVALQFIRDDLLGLASPYRQPNPNLTVRSQLDRANAELKARIALPPKVEAALRQIMGSVYFGLGEYAMAIDLLERALELERQHLSADHEETLRTIHILAETCWWSGDDERMLRLAQDGLALSRKARGETNLMTLHLLADEVTALVYAEAGATAETERLITNALRVTSSTLGDAHDLTFRLSVILAHHHIWRGQYDKVESILSQAIAQERSVLPETHPLMLIARGTLARAYADQNKLVQAEALDRQLLEVRQQVLGTNHPLTVNTEIHLASIYLRSGDAAQCEAIHRRLLKLLDDGHLLETRFVVRSLFNLVAHYRLHTEWVKIDELAGAVLAVGRKQFRDESIKVITMHDEWARSLMEQGRYGEAEVLFQTVVDVRTKYKASGRLFSAMSRLGYCLFKQGKQPERTESLLNEGYQQLEQRMSQLPELIQLEIVGGALQRLTEFYEASGQIAQAATFRSKLSDLERKEGRLMLRTDFIPP